MPGFDSARYRTVLGHFPTGVTVVTADADDGPVGITIGSFTSVSLDPPLVGFLPGKASDRWPAIERAGSFCVNVLAEDQADLCWAFAKESDDTFAGIDWRAAPSGSPILPDVLAWMDCTIHDVVDEGDHWFVVGLVTMLESEREHGPLLFFRGTLGGFHPS